MLGMESDNRLKALESLRPTLLFHQGEGVIKQIIRV
jgi:hypothetical protein